MRWLSTVASPYSRVGFNLLSGGEPNRTAAFLIVIYRFLARAVAKKMETGQAISFGREFELSQYSGAKVP